MTNALWKEARLRGAYVLLSILLSVGCSLWWRVELLYGATRPILHGTTQWVYLDVTEGFEMMWKVALSSALVVTVPLFVYHGWSYWAPGWYHRDRRLWTLLCWKVCLWGGLSGLLLLLVVVPMLGQYFLSFQVHEGPWTLAWMPRLSTFLRYSVHLGWCTVALMALVWVPWWSLSRWRGPCVWGGVLVASILAPPDLVSQWLVVMYLWGMMELVMLGGIFEWVKSGKPA